MIRRPIALWADFHEAAQKDDLVAGAGRGRPGSGSRSHRAAPRRPPLRRTREGEPEPGARPRGRNRRGSPGPVWRSGILRGQSRRPRRSGGGPRTVRLCRVALGANQFQEPVGRAPGVLELEARRRQRQPDAPRRWPLEFRSVARPHRRRRGSQGARPGHPDSQRANQFQNGRYQVDLLPGGRPPRRDSSRIAGRRLARAIRRLAGTDRPLQPGLRRVCRARALAAWRQRWPHRGLHRAGPKFSLRPGPAGARPRPRSPRRDWRRGQARGAALGYSDRRPGPGEEHPPLGPAAAPQRRLVARLSRPAGSALAVAVRRHRAAGWRDASGFARVPGHRLPLAAALGRAGETRPSAPGVAARTGAQHGPAARRRRRAGGRPERRRRLFSGGRNAGPGCRGRYGRHHSRSAAHPLRRGPPALRRRQRASPAVAVRGRRPDGHGGRRIRMALANPERRHLGAGDAHRRRAAGCYSAPSPCSRS